MSAVPARRYVLPLFEVARDHNVLDVVAADLKALDNALSATPELGAFLAAPTIERSVKRAALEAIFANASSFTLNFLRGVVAKNRSEVLHYAYRIYKGLLDAYRGVTPGLVETATPVDEATFASVVKAVSERFGGKIELQRQVDPSLIGGVRVRVGNQVIDASVKGRLEKLRTTLTGE